MRAKWEVRARQAWARGRSSSPKFPIRCRKSQLIEQIAELLEEKKLPLLGDVRDESAEQVRLVLEPKTRSVEPEVLMETLFRATALESRFPLNMNVLTADRTPWCWVCAACCAPGWTIGTRCWSAAPAIGWRRSQRRLEVLDGYLLVYLNLDEVIRIIREEDQPQAGADRSAST